ncbi:MAG: hypothetical protein RBR06_10980 [Desulfuromonadaceae bacterium]|nr:hypothetical protein [Desulfuromonadaceae bacterium]
MLVKPEQKAVYILAKAVLRQNNLKVAVLQSGQHLHHPPSNPPTLLDWTISYVMCLPQDSEERRLLDMLHLNPECRWTPEETRYAARCYKQFYQKIKEQRLYSIGNKWLNSGGRNLVNAYLVA